MDFIVGILALIAGLGVCFLGLRIFFFLLPIWGFVVGFLIGAAAVTAAAGDGFLATTLGLVVGAVVGLIFGALSYLYWYLGVILAAGYAGATLGGAFFAALGVSSAWVLFILSIVVAAIFIFAALALNYPIYVVILSTALAGSGLAIGGLLLVLNRINRDQIGTGELWHRIQDHWVLWILWIVVAALGVGAQLARAAAASLPTERWVRIRPNTALR